MNMTGWLAILGGLVLAAVVAHGAWTARKAGPRRAEEQIEPMLDEQNQLREEQAESAATLPEEAASSISRPARRPSARIDALIDAIATLTLEQPISGEMVLSHLPGSRRAGTKPFHIEGLNVETGEWELPFPGLAGSRYGEFQAGVQMANRSGAMNEIEYSEFVQKVQLFADGIGAFVQFPDMLDVVARARELDQFASAHDAQLAVVLRPRDTAWTLGYVLQIASRHGFVAGAIPGRLVLAADEEGAPPILSLSFDAQAAMAENPQLSSLRELLLSLDVPQTPEAQEPFASWQEAARSLAGDIDADICDDHGQVLNLHAFSAIGQELSALYVALASHDLAAGSLATRRLFS